MHAIAGSLLYCTPITVLQHTSIRSCMHTGCPASAPRTLTHSPSESAARPAPLLGRRSCPKPSDINKDPSLKALKVAAQSGLVGAFMPAVPLAAAPAAPPAAPPKSLALTQSAQSRCTACPCCCLHAGCDARRGPSRPARRACQTLTLTQSAQSRCAACPCCCLRAGCGARHALCRPARRARQT